MPIVLISGPPGSGKSSTAQALAKKTGWPAASFGDFVRQKCINKGLATDRRTLQEVGQRLVESNVDAFCTEILEFVEWRPGKGSILDGLRHIRVLDSLRKVTLNAELLLVAFIDAPQPVINERLRSRGEDIQLAEAEEPTEREVSTALRQAAGIIVDGTLSPEVLADRILKCVPL